MNLSNIFDEKPERWGLRGDPYFWDYLKEKAEDIEIASPDDLEKWIKKEHLALSGKEMTRSSMVRIEEFAHGGMSSGGVCGTWWTETGIPLLKSRLSKIPLPPCDDVSARLKGEWLNTVKYENFPRSVLRFEGNKVNFELIGRTGSAEYKVTEKKNADSFNITFAYSYKVKRGNGRIVEYTDRPELMFHVENGRPILSETAFEFDGRGLIIIGEYLRQEDFVDGFQSELSHRLNDQTPIPTMQEVPEEDVPPKVE